MRPGVALAAAAALVLGGCGSSATPAASPSSRPLRAASLACLVDPTYGQLGDDGRTLTLDGKGEDDADGLPVDKIACVLKQLQVTDAVIAHIDSTRALDGMQTDKWAGYTARWTYHPNSGVNITIQEAA